MRSKKLNDIWEHLAAIYNNDVPQKIVIANVDCTTDRHFCSGTYDEYKVLCYWKFETLVNVDQEILFDV